MKVLIIGGTGLMSTEITTQLLGRGDEVWHFNRGQTPARYSGAVKTIRGDRWQYPAFESALAGLRFDAVIDMVAFHPDNTRAVLKALRGRMGQLRREP
jgi:nucleoside-diphosphate-sugar epimerase